MNTNRILTLDDRGGAVSDPTLLEPWGPFEMGGFEGCTDRDPNHCACGTDQQPTCELCGQEIEPGERAWSRQWPCYNTLPLDDANQDWDVISWHDDCPQDRNTPTTPVAARGDVRETEEIEHG